MVLDNLFSLIGLGTNKQMNAVMNASMNVVPGEENGVQCVVPEYCLNYSVLKTLYFHGLFVS
jgi:hypothetical protein